MEFKVMNVKWNQNKHTCVYLVWCFCSGQAGIQVINAETSKKWNMTSSSLSRCRCREIHVETSTRRQADKLFTASMC